MRLHVWQHVRESGQDGVAGMIVVMPAILRRKAFNLLSVAADSVFSQY